RHLTAVAAQAGHAARRCSAEQTNDRRVGARVARFVLGRDLYFRRDALATLERLLHGTKTALGELEVQLCQHVRRNASGNSLEAVHLLTYLHGAGHGERTRLVHHCRDEELADVLGRADREELKRRDHVGAHAAATTASTAAATASTTAAAARRRAGR